VSVTILQGDVCDMLATLPTESVQVVVTSPPYYALRDYGVDGQIGLEKTPGEFIATLVGVFDEVRRVMRQDAVLFCNLGDSYAGSGKGPTGSSGIGDQRRRQGFIPGEGGNQNGSRNRDGLGGVVGSKPKDLLLIPERFAIAMQDAGWWVRSRIAWCKTSAMPESVKDRPTSAWEHIWMFTRSARYFWDQEAVRQPNTSADDPRNRPDYVAKRERNVGGRTDGYTSSHGAVGWNPAGANLRNFWLLGPEPSREEHYAAFPSEIPRRCILAASRPGDTVLDPFLGSGTTALVAGQLQRNAIGIELNPKYAEMARRRISNDAGMFADVTVAS